jgi:hypothetical protein
MKKKEEFIIFFEEELKDVPPLNKLVQAKVWLEYKKKVIENLKQTKLVEFEDE